MRQRDIGMFPASFCDRNSSTRRASDYASGKTMDDSDIVLKLQLNPA
jgi:hypothetical protein